MPNKPIIDIQVNSADFERFAKLFAEYSKTLDEQPAAWQKLNAAMGNAGTAGDALASGALTAKEAIALAGAQAEIIAGALKEAVKAQDALGDSSHATNKRMSELAKTARSLGSEIAGVGQWVLRLGSGALAGLGLGAIVGGFGIGGLTDALTSRGRAAGGVGLSPGQLASFQAYGQRFLGEGALHAAAAAQLSYGSVAPLSMLGIDFNRAQGMSSADLAFEELKGAVRNWQAAKAAGLAPGSDPRVLAYQSLGGDLEDVRRAVLQGGVPAVAAAQGRYRLGAAGMEYDMRSWQNFKDQLDAAGRQIEATFGKALTPLVPEFTQLSKEFVTAFASFAKSKDMGILIDDVKVGLKGFVGWLEGPDSKKLASNLALVADEVFAVAEKLKWLIPKPATPPKWASDPKWLLPHGGQNWTASIGSWWHNLTTFSGGADAMQKAMLGAIAGQESSGSATIVNKTSGALGRYQFMPGTADQYLGSSWVAKYGSTATAGGRANFLGSPAAQQRAALAYLADLEKVALAKHLSGTEFIKGIAEGWYGGTGAVGNPNISGGPGYPTTGQYGMQVLERLIKALLTKQANGTKVSITNQTSARVAVSVNAVATG